MLKLTIPTEDGLYDDLADHPRVIRVVALSGGYSTDEACERLARQPKMIASFSRALAEGLTNKQLAARLEISTNTVKFHLSNIFDKLSVKNRAQAIAHFYASKAKSGG